MIVGNRYSLSFQDALLSLTRCYYKFIAHSLSKMLMPFIESCGSQQLVLSIKWYPRQRTRPRLAAYKLLYDFFSLLWHLNTLVHFSFLYACVIKSVLKSCTLERLLTLCWISRLALWAWWSLTHTYREMVEKGCWKHMKFIPESSGFRFPEQVAFLRRKMNSLF